MLVLAAAVLATLSAVGAQTPIGSVFSDADVARMRAILNSELQNSRFQLQLGDGQGGGGGGIQFRCDHIPCLRSVSAQLQEQHPAGLCLPWLGWLQTICH